MPQKEKENLKSSNPIDVLQEQHLDEIPEDFALSVCIKTMENLIKTQSKYLRDDYNIGLYNGLALGYAIITGKEPEFYKGGEEQ